MSVYDLHSLERKKYKRAVNKLIRDFNKSMEEDWLWNGRFKILQKQAIFEPFSDHSGALYIVNLVIVDKKTGKEESQFFDNYSICWELYKWANKCIVDYWNVWSEVPDPRTQAKLEGRAPEGE